MSPRSLTTCSASAHYELPGRNAIATPSGWRRFTMMADDAGVVPRHCRLCGGIDLKLVADLGMLPVSRPHRPRKGDERRYPLAVHSCASCGLLPGTEPGPPELLYLDSENYTTSFQAHPHVDELIRTLLAHPDATSVVEIGCNDESFPGKPAIGGLRPAHWHRAQPPAADWPNREDFPSTRPS